MSMVFLHWQISRFLLAQQAAATVPADIQALFDRPDVHATQRIMTLEKIARLIEGGVDNLSVIARFNRADDEIADEIPYQMIGDHQELSDSTSIAARPHLIVIGDTVENLEKGLGKEKFVTLRIGFLYGPIEKLPKFLAAFHIVISDEHSHDVPRRIIDAIGASKGQIKD